MTGPTHRHPLPGGPGHPPDPIQLGPLVRELHGGLVAFGFAAVSQAPSLRGQTNRVLHEHTVPLPSLQPA